jgi:hypothetical protein
MSAFGELLFWAGVAFGAVLGFGACAIIIAGAV